MPTKVTEKENWLVGWAPKQPLTVVIAVIGVVFCVYLSLLQMRKDILPNLCIPTFYVALPYTGMDASQVESYTTYYCEHHFLSVAGIQHVGSKNAKSAYLPKPRFYLCADMTPALTFGPKLNRSPKNWVGSASSRMSFVHQGDRFGQRFSLGSG